MHRKLLIVACALAVSACGSAKSPSEPTDPNVVLYTALGASDTTGFGGSVVCLPLIACSQGTGYVQTVERRFASSGKTVTLLNLGIPGAVLSPQMQTLGNSLGRGIVGNFDANTVGAALQAGMGGIDPAAYVQTHIDSFGRDLRTLLTGVKDRAPDARVVFLNLPNLAGLPYASGHSLNEKRWLQQIAVGFSAQVNALRSQGALVIDLMCDAAFYQGSMYSGDGFHPNDAGYARLGDLVFAAASTGTAPSPRSTCPQMSLF